MTRLNAHTMILLVGLYAGAQESNQSNQTSQPNVPEKAGTYYVPHPDSSKGLIKINRDGSYQYKTEGANKSQSSTVRAAGFSPPTVKNETGTTFEDMYGSGYKYGVLMSYDWFPFQKFGALGLSTELGFTTMKAKGYLADGGRALEVYNLYMVPASLFVMYRFEYSKRQWVVPYAYGGGTFWGLYEQRDDGKRGSFAGAGAAGGGGGVLLSITRWDHQTGFNLAREFDIADMWLVFDGRAMGGLNDKINFTGTILSAGIAVDY